MNIYNCPRCGEDHINLKFHPPTIPNSYPYAICPKRQQFITLSKGTTEETEQVLAC